MTTTHGRVNRRYSDRRKIHRRKIHRRRNTQDSSLLPIALRALCLTRDYIGEESLPALEGWEWYDAGKILAEHLGDHVWAIEFKKRVNRYLSTEIRKAFRPGDWVVSTNTTHSGCYKVFEGVFCDYHPFSYLGDFDPLHFRLATQEEIDTRGEEKT